MLFPSTDLQLLKEQADQKAKNTDVSEALSSWFEPRSSLEIVDLHPGTGANVRSLAPLLPQDQKWVLYVRNNEAKAIAQDYITRWAPAFQKTSNGIELERQGLKILIQFKVQDITTYENVLKEESCALVVIDTSLNALTLPVLQKLSKDIASKKTVLHARLVYDGRLKFQPHHAADNAFIAALNRKLMLDTGYGSPRGPQALNDLSEYLRLHEYSILEGQSDLHVRETDKELMHTLQIECAEAQRVLLKGIHDKMVAQWLAFKRRNIHICQKDLLALPN